MKIGDIIGYTDRWGSVHRAAVVSFDDDKMVLLTEAGKTVVCDRSAETAAPLPAAERLAARKVARETLR